MTISKKTMQVAAAGAVFGLFSLCSIIAVAASFLLPGQRDWWVGVAAFCLPMLLGLGLAFLAYFIAGRMIKDDVESLPASALASTATIFDDASPVPPVRKANKRLFRWLFFGSAGFSLMVLDAIAFIIWRWEALELVAIEVVLAILALIVYFLIVWVQTRPRGWMDEVGWPAISGLCLLATVGFFVFAVGGPALGQTLSVRFGQVLPGTAIVGTVLGYALWAVIAGVVIYSYNRLIDGSPSKGVIAVTIALPVLAMAAFFGFGMIEMVMGSFAEVWLLYAILAAVLAMIFIVETEATEGGLLSLLVSLAVFAMSWLISWAILSAVGATWGMFGQGAAIVAVATAYGIYLSWERSSGKGGK